MSSSNKVFVSPGVYTSEVDLTYVAQSVGVTTLGLVGETLKGPSFEPILISTFDDFQTYFGSTSPEKDGIGNPKYELAYIANAYLQESNQLFVTRVLGLTGYLPYNTFGVTTLGGVTFNSGATPTQTTGTLIPTLTGVTGSTYYAELSGKTATTGEDIPTFIVDGGPYTDGQWFTIGLVPSGSTISLTGSTITGPIGSNSNQNWYNVFFHETGSVIDGLYSYLFVYSGTSSTFNVTRFNYTGATSNGYDNIVVAALRSRGTYVLESLNLEVTGQTSMVLSSTAIGSNPLGDFTISVTGLTSGIKSFTCSMDITSTKYIEKVLGVGVYDKDKASFPVYVHEAYPNTLADLYSRGLIRGLSTTFAYQAVGNDFLTEWDSPMSPMIVSEVRGGITHDLFQVMTVADGNSANSDIKITITNVDLDLGEFDIWVRDFNDTDDNLTILETYTRCSMDPSVPGYIGLKIGTSDGQYPIQSGYIMLNLVDGAPSDAVPAGFRGYTASSLGGNVLGHISYKNTYFNAGDFTGTYDTLGNPILAGQPDKIKKVSLGLYSNSNVSYYDNDIFNFKGVTASKLTPGFHLSSEASSITGDTVTGYAFITTPYDLENQVYPLDTLPYRKFTFGVAGGYDGWDIYRTVRTNTDQYVFGKRIYVSGQTINGGVFSPTVGNSDYYAYLQAIQTFQNPEAVDINILATPGIDFFNNSSLVNETIDMVETDRADSLYIINSPNVPTAQEIVDDMTTVAIDSNYSATYWPWVQIRDTINSTQIYISPTAEVCRNIALTDNVSYPWFAVAGYSRGLVNSIKAVKKLTLDERDLLYKNRINPIATFSDTGTIIWGNKTLQVRESALDRINVRRLLLQTRKLISAVAVRLLFEQNDDQVRQEFQRLVNPILESIKKERGLYDFRVTVSSDPADLDANLLSGKIYIKPTRSLEFIDLEFVITPTGASFDNI